MCPCLISPQEVPQVFPNRPNHLALEPSAPEQRLLVTSMREHIDFMGKGTVDRFTKSDLKRQTWMLSYVSYVSSPKNGANEMASSEKKETGEID